MNQENEKAWFPGIITAERLAVDEAGAAWLLVPYLCWVSFASILNFSIILLNR